MIDKTSELTNHVFCEDRNPEHYLGIRMYPSVPYSFSAVKVSDIRNVTDRMIGHYFVAHSPVANPPIRFSENIPFGKF